MDWSQGRTNPVIAFLDFNLSWKLKMDFKWNFNPEYIPNGLKPRLNQSSYNIKILVQAERWNWIANGLQSNVQSWADSKSIEAKVELVQLQH